MNATDSELKDHPVDLELSSSSPDALAMEDDSGRQHGKLVRELKNRHVAMIRCVPPYILIPCTLPELPISSIGGVSVEVFSRSRVVKPR
jgi:hypothetical protein